MKTRLAATALPMISLWMAACTSMQAKAPPAAQSSAIAAPLAPSMEGPARPAASASSADPGELAMTAHSAPLPASPTAASEDDRREDLAAGRSRSESLPPPAFETPSPSAKGDAPRMAARAYAPPAPARMAPMAGGLGALGSVGSAAVGAGRGGAVAPSGAPAPSLAEPLVVAQSPSIKAGEWDDNANYREFQRWLGTEERTPFHHVDVSERRFLVVRDAAGKAVPRCPVVVTDGQQHRTSLVTSPSGHAILFPHAEGLAGRDLVATAACEGTSAQTSFSLEANGNVVDLRLPSARTLPLTRTIDVAFILDTTGSMSEEIQAVKSTVQKVTASLDGSDVRVRIGMVAYKDRGDEYVTKIYPMTTALGAFQGEVASIYASGGGDMPESVNEGIHVALNGLQWNPDALAQFAFLIGDAPPHLDYAQDFDYATDMKTAAHRGVQIFTVAASGMDDLGQVVWRQVAEYTNATNLFVLRGGAGPQSTGAGDPKSSCGGTQTQYTSGQLDVLILHKIRQELAGIDRDPMRIAGLNGDENAKPCNERMIATE
jgi:hypothetical protein